MQRIDVRGVFVSSFLFAIFFSTLTFASDDIVVVRVGTGATTLSAATAATFLDRHASDGTSVSSIALPTAPDGQNVNLAFTLSGTGTTEGMLAGSPDGNYLTLAGYAVAPGGSITTAVRVVARVDSAGMVNTSTALSNGFGTAVRGAVTDDGGEFWITGSGTGNGGIWYELLGLNGGTQLVSSPSSVRAIQIVDGQLYADSGSSGTTNIFAVGSGISKTTDPTLTPLPGMPTSNASPYEFAFFDRSSVAGIDTVYVADDRAIASGGGIQKWTSNGSTWTLQKTFTGTLATGTLATGVRGLAAEVVSGKVVIYATTTEATQNKLVKMTDDGSASPAITTIATAAANTVYRGVALAWVPPLLDDIFDDGFE